MQLRLLSLAGLMALASAQSNITLFEALHNEPSVSNLTAFLSTVSGLNMTLNALENVTVLAPNNDAVAALMNSSMASVLKAQDSMLITSLLAYHVINATINSSQITSTAAFPQTLLSNEMFENVTGSQVLEAVKEGDSVKIYSGLRTNATVTKADIAFNGGIIHVIDSFLVIPENLTTTATNVGLSSVVGALKAAGDTGQIDVADDLTVFAPNNAAFQMIGSALGNVTKEDLMKIIGYHAIVGAPVMYSSTLKNGSVQSHEGTNLTITVEGNGDVYVNSAKVIQPDVLIANGVVHVIDNVLNPMDSSAMPNTSASSQAPVFSGASSVSDVPFTSGIPMASTTLPTNPKATGGASSSSSSAFAMPRATGAVGAIGAGVLFAVGGYMIV